MKHQLLFEAYVNAFSTRQFDDLHDVLAPDFHFSGPTVEITGRDHYIQYSKDIFIVQKIETKSLHAISEDGFVHEYIFSYLDYDGYSFEKIAVKESFLVSNNLLASSKISYDANLLSAGFKNILTKFAPKYDIGAMNKFV